MRNMCRRCDGDATKMKNSDPICEADVLEFVESQSDFAFELLVQNVLATHGFHPPRRRPPRISRRPLATCCTP